MDNENKVDERAANIQKFIEVAGMSAMGIARKR